MADAHPEVAVVMLTMQAEDDAVFAAIRAGARGYVLKGADESELLRVVRAASQGEALFGHGDRPPSGDFLWPIAAGVAGVP